MTSPIAVANVDHRCLVVATPSLLRILSISFNSAISADVLGFWHITHGKSIRTIYSIHNVLLVCCCDGSLIGLEIKPRADNTHIDFTQKWVTSELISVVDDMRPIYEQYAVVAMGSDVVIIDVSTGAIGPRTNLFSVDITSVHVLTYLNAKHVVACAIDGSISCWSVHAEAGQLPRLADCEAFPASKGCRLCVCGDAGGAMLGYVTKHVIDSVESKPHCTLRLFRNPFIEHNICFTPVCFSSFMIDYAANNYSYMGFALFVVNALFSSMYGECATAYTFNIGQPVDRSAESTSDAVREVAEALLAATYIACCRVSGSNADEHATGAEKLNDLLCISLGIVAFCNPQ